MVKRQKVLHANEVAILRDRIQDVSPPIPPMSTYDALFQRNLGYISAELQSKIRNTRLLIAGCGIGSTIAEAAVRIGFSRLTLADGDSVQIHNLNRQAFSHLDIGEKKVEALARRLRAINPELELAQRDGWITETNADRLVAEADFLFDTIDFLDISAITALHDAAHRLRKPIISAVSAGFGAAACYFPPTDGDCCLFRRLFGLPSSGSVTQNSYVEHFAHFINRIGHYLDPSVAKAMAKALTLMEDGTPCPAPHVVVGAYTVASLAITAAVRVLDNKEVASAPRLILNNVDACCSNSSIDLTPVS